MGLHQNEPLRTAGASLGDAESAVILAHGRGASATSILQMATEFDTDGIAYLAPQAARSTWYPNPFLDPVDSNEPGRTSGLEAIENAFETAADGGIPADRVLLAGFSQWACLSSDFVARRPHRYGGLAVLSGGLLGPSIDPDEFEGDLEAALFFWAAATSTHTSPRNGCEKPPRFSSRWGGDVSTRIYEGMGHGVNEDELEVVGGMIAGLTN
jgi:phospholipase/carboxylesterase